MTCPPASGLRAPDLNLRSLGDLAPPYCGFKVAFQSGVDIHKVFAPCLAGRGVDIAGRRSENAGHMKEISTLTATLLLT